MKRELILQQVSDTDQKTRYNALKLLVEMDGIKAIPTLQAILSDPSAIIRRYAATTIIELGGSDAFPLVIPVLHNTYEWGAQHIQARYLNRKIHKSSQCCCPI
jgi:HEAT repeat protein